MKKSIAGSSDNPLCNGELVSDGKNVVIEFKSIEKIEEYIRSAEDQKVAKAKIQHDLVALILEGGRGGTDFRITWKGREYQLGWGEPLVTTEDCDIDTARRKINDFLG